MATLYTDIATSQNLENGKDRVREGETASGNVLMAIAEYALTGSEAANDVINIVKLPPGARVVPALSRASCDDADATLTLDIGDDDSAGADDDRYGNEVDVSTGGDASFNDGASLGAAALQSYKLQNEAWIQAKVTSAASLTNGNRVTFHVAYVAAA